MISLRSSAFGEGEPIPRVHATLAAGGENRSIPLEWVGVPAEARSLLLVVVDRSAHDWVHWVVVDIDAVDAALPAGASGGIAPPARELGNTFGTQGWGGPQPPVGSGAHTYEAILYALDVSTLPLSASPALADIEDAVYGRVLGKARLSGTFERS